MAKVLNLKNINYKIPEGAIYIGRAAPRYGLESSGWGNPWRIGEIHPADGHRLTRQETIDLYRANLLRMLVTKRDDGSFILDLRELRGKDLVCWCAPLPCHGDILLEIANA